MEAILEKLSKVEFKKNASKTWENWSIEERYLLLKIYHTFCLKESDIYDLIYMHHGCDTYEDIFRDYNDQLLEDKASGVKEALDNLEENINTQND